MAWLALLALLLTAMLALEAIGAERNFRRRAAPPPPEPAAGSPRDRSKRDGVALTRSRFARTALPERPQRALRTRHFGSCL